ncbi:hypothetical protein AAFF_G00353350 [Aldrovandia affinis]|uniref:Uncharacterized protein n=1 Tax=Aldrovandia affinis TaxID=143900 RepID=A0AAD7R585_9TELE|nr:hypothetical protein AAFF_G00353350 [Aldrovandia affinis]
MVFLKARPSFSGTAGTKDSASVLLEAIVDPDNQLERGKGMQFFDNLRDMEEASWAIQQRGQEQHDQYMQMLLESQAE